MGHSGANVGNTRRLSASLSVETELERQVEEHQTALVSRVRAYGRAGGHFMTIPCPHVPYVHQMAKVLVHRPNWYGFMFHEFSLSFLDVSGLASVLATGPRSYTGLQTKWFCIITISLAGFTCGSLIVYHLGGLFVCPR